MTHGWVRTWSASPHMPLEALEPVPRFADTTVRHAVRVSGGGQRVRVRFTNEYGTTPLVIGAACVGLATSGGERPLTFSGRSDAVVPAGAPILSDPLDLSVPALAELSISLYLPEPVQTPTCHGMGVQTSWASPGDSGSTPAVPLPLQAFLSAVEVVVPDGPASTVVVIGDSITDGFGSTPNANRRWTDRLAERCGPALHVANQGISGNRVLNDGFGASVSARFDRDVLTTPGLGHVVLSAGMNDIAVSSAPPADGHLAEFLKPFTGQPVTADDLIAGYRQLIARAPCARRADPCLHARTLGGRRALLGGG